MTAYDWLLIFLAGGLVVLFTYVRMVRALLTLFILWLSTFLSALLYREVVFRMQAVTGRNPVLARGVVFDILLILFLVVGYVLVSVSFPVTRLPKLGIFDNLMGLVLGAMVAVVLVALLVNSMGVMVVERWEGNESGWANLRTSYLRSGLRPLTSPIVAAYARLFVPFFGGMPPVLYPQ